MTGRLARTTVASLRCALATALVTALTISTGADAWAADVTWTTVVIRVYDGTALPARSWAKALKLTTATLEGAGVEPAWRFCEPHDTQPESCAQPLAAGELVVRLVRSGDAEVRTGQQPLGDAVVGTVPGTAVLATIYQDRVVQVARAARVNAESLLGRAIAHEIGHLLLASPRHAPSGLMRPTWRSFEIGRARHHDWEFRPEDVAAIATRLLTMAP